MYIEYITPQRVADPRISEYIPPEGDYRPTWLIRTSDWQKVPGNQAKNGYCTLSYCWEQSGGIVQKDNGEYECINEPRHRLYTGVEKRRMSNLFRKHTKTKTTYDGILQQVCKDFGIDYLWYDKICIDQTNKAEKHREIKQMHLIYSNARYTVAMVPEIYIRNSKDFETREFYSTNTEAQMTCMMTMLESLWWTRSWTLEEVMMSTQMVVVGRNTHFWCLAQHAAKQNGIFNGNDVLSANMLGYKDQKAKSANRVLHYAKSRTSTKEHDKVYALANIFHGIVSIDFDYDSDVSTVMRAFYRQLAEHDLSVMCFGTVLDDDGPFQEVPTMGSYNLPSWTGANRNHISSAIADIVFNRGRKNYSIDDDMRLHLNCKGYTINPIKYTEYGVWFDEVRRLQAEVNRLKVITTLNDIEGEYEGSALDWSQWCFSCTGAVPTHYWMPDTQTFSFPIVVLSLTEDCDECVMPMVLFNCLQDIVRETEDGSHHDLIGHDYQYLLPVLKKSSDSVTYKAIGIARIHKFRFSEENRPTPQEYLDNISSSLNTECQEFIIE